MEFDNGDSSLEMFVISSVISKIASIHKLLEITEVGFNERPLVWLHLVPVADWPESGFVSFMEDGGAERGL